MKNKRQEKIAFATLDDRSARIDVTLFSDLYASAMTQHLLIKDELLIVEGDVSLDEYSGQFKMIGRNIISLTQLRSYKKARIVVKTNNEIMNDAWVEKLKAILQPYSADTCLVRIHYQRPESNIQLELGPEWRVNPEQSLLDQLKQHAGAENIAVEY